MNSISKNCISYLLTLIFCIFASGCTDLPDSAQAMSDAKQVAQNDAVIASLFGIKDLVRENGWEDANHVQYHIRFNYSLVAQKNYPGMIVEYLKYSEEEFKNASNADLNALKIQLGFSSWANDLAKAFGSNSDLDSAKELLQKYPEINHYFQENMKPYRNDKTIQFIALLLVHKQLNELGVPHDASAGYEIPRTVTFTYFKTEKGWIKRE